MSLNKEQKSLAIQNMGRSIELFGRTILKDVFYQSTPDFHREIFKTFHDKSNNKILIVAPRGHSKSTIAGLLLPLYHIFFDKGSNEGVRNIVLMSKTHKHAIKLLDTIKDQLATNPVLHYFFGRFDESNAIKWTETEIILPNKAIITALGTGQQVRGIKYKSTRMTLGIVDDPEDENNTKTIDAMDANLNWVLAGVLPAVDDIYNSRVVVIGTVIHKYCIVSRLKNIDGWKKHWYKAIQDDGHTVLWPDRRPLSWLLEEKKAMASIGKASLWHMEYQNEVVAPETQPFKEEYIRYHDYTIETYADYRYAQLVDKSGKKRIPVNVYMGIDPASSVESTADFSAILILAMDKNKNIYIIDIFHKRVHPMDLAQVIQTYYQKYQPNAVNIETVGYQEMLRDYFRYNKIYIPGMERKNQPRTQKSKRILSFQPHFADGVVYIKKDMMDFVDELIQYNPERRNNQDDQLDAFYYAFKDARPPFREEGIESADELMKEHSKRTYYDWRAL